MVASKNSIGACLVCYCICCPCYVHLYGHCACIRELPVPGNIGYVIYAYIYIYTHVFSYIILSHTYLFVYRFFISINFLSRQVIQCLIFVNYYLLPFTDSKRSPMADMLVKDSESGSNQVDSSVSNTCLTSGCVRAGELSSSFFLSLPLFLPLSLSLSIHSILINLSSLPLFPNLFLPFTFFLPRSVSLSQVPWERKVINPSIF